MGREVEWKYRATPEVLSAIWQCYTQWQTIIMETTYFDTPQGELEKRKWMLRCRLENGAAVTTVKVPLSDGSRGEWEAAGTPPDTILELWKQGAPPELVTLTKEGLGETCSARFTRLSALVELPRCSVELALDQGSFFGGDREAPLCELEVELKTGSEADAAAFAAEIAARYRLEIEPKSKVQRAMALGKEKEP